MRVPHAPRRPLALLVTTLLLTGASGVQQDSHRLLGSKGFTDAVVVTGGAWVRRGGGMQAEGGGHSVSTHLQVGRGDFKMRALLTFEKLDSSGALFVLGDNVFCFADRKGGSPLFVRGPNLNPKGKDKLVLPGTKGRTPEKQKFEFVVRRDAGTLRILFDRELVHSIEVGANPLGRIGFQPRRSLLRINDWSVTGALMDPASDGGDALRRLQPAINEAIDRGVAFLLEKQQRDGSWPYESQRYRNGQTALCMYTLLKSGVEPEHPAVQRARAFLEAAPPRETYALACQMMAFEATKDPALKPRIGELLDQLLRWQVGGWSYPWDHAMANWHEREGLIDLSNSQYAALGLRAGEFAGHDVPDRAWKRLLRDALGHQTKVRKVEARQVEGQSTTGKQEIAGFGYRPGVEATGSMTTAGLAVVELCRQGLDKQLGSSDRRKIARSRKLALDWLDYNFDVVENPGKAQWVYYYLYGLERVGSLLAISKIGSHAWYYEGAERLVKIQRDDGGWAEQNEEADTCFALLFLQRATSRGTGPNVKAPDDLLLSEDHDQAVRFRASGKGRLTVWLTGISDEMRDTHGVKRGRRKELFLTSVEYLLDGVLVERVECPGTAWKGEGHAVRLAVDKAGAHTLSMRVTLALPEKADKLIDQPVVLESALIEFDVDAGLEPWMLDLARGSASPLLRDHGCVATATSTVDARRGPGKAIDGRQSTNWLFKTQDVEPTLRLDFKRPLRASAIVLQQAASRPADRYSFDLVRTVELRFPGTKQDPVRAELPEDAFLPATIALPADMLLRQIEITILETEEGGTQYREAGFSEINFLPVR